MRTAAGWRQFPESDRCGWFKPDEARQKLNAGQVALVDRLLTKPSRDDLDGMTSLDQPPGCGNSIRC